MDPLNILKKREFLGGEEADCMFLGLEEAPTTKDRIPAPLSLEDGQWNHHVTLV